MKMASGSSGRDVENTGVVRRTKNVHE